MEQLRKKMEADLKIGGYGESTQQIYTHVSAEQISVTRSPYDLLGTPAARLLG